MQKKKQLEAVRSFSYLNEHCVFRIIFFDTFSWKQASVGELIAQYFLLCFGVLKMRVLLTFVVK